VTEPSRREISDVRVLAALAHPVRLQLLGYLLEIGPRTATECAAVVDATPSACSYHLRHLERFGLVERADDDELGDAGRADRRERRWRTSATGFAFGGTAPSEDGPAEHAARHALAVAGVDENARLAKRYLAESDSLPAVWQDAAGFSSYGLRVTPEELEAIGSALDDVLRPYIGATRDHAPDDAEAVHVTLQVFRRTDPS
jgi:DNA-binding transcriptional ArsR family regulator